MKQPLVSICVPTLRDWSPHLMRLVESLDCHTWHVDRELIIVSGSGTVRGYTAPMNQALRAAQGEYLLALNDDVEVSEGWLDPLLAEATSGTWAVTPDMSHTDGPQVYAPYCLLLRREALARVGELDEQFVLWGSDIDYARRLIEAGHPPVKVKLPNPIIHHVGETSAANPDLNLSRIQLEDIDRYQAKWGINCEQDKGRMALL